MPRSLKLYIVGVVTLGAIALVVTTLVFPPEPGVALRFVSVQGQPPVTIEIWAGISFWIVVTALASAMPVQMPRGAQVAVSIAPIVASVILGGPAVGGWVAALGSTELREVRGKVPWYGTLSNHAGLFIPAIAAGLVFHYLASEMGPDAVLLANFLAAVVASAVFYTLNVGLAGWAVALRTGQSAREVLIGDSRGTALNLFALAPLAWVVAQMYLVAWWATLVFALPLYTTRRVQHQVVEMREMFTQTITALSGAVDQRDPFTGKHSFNVQRIALDIGRQMRVGEADLEALEWGGLLHDVGKIGVPDAVLLKTSKLDKSERMVMNSHPVKGAEIIGPVRKLAPELPIILHHHEWYNGSGYPHRLVADEIPKLARILHVADAFEAMTAARPYRMVPLTAAQAIGELRKFAGIQFDPEVVDAFVRTSWAADIEDPGRTETAPVPLKPRPVPLLGDAAALIVGHGGPATAEAPNSSPTA
jgi:putative nucleotidyltransferase with HDIG domain